MILLIKKIRKFEVKNLNLKLRDKRMLQNWHSQQEKKKKMPYIECGVQLFISMPHTVAKPNSQATHTECVGSSQKNRERERDDVGWGPTICRLCYT